MCKSGQPQQSNESVPAEAAVPSDSYHPAKSFELDGTSGEQQQHLLEVIEHDESSGIVLFGSFCAGALVGVIICAPTVVVLLIGAGAAAVTKSDSKVGKFFRRVGKWSSDILIAVFRAAREFNHEYELMSKAKEGAQRAGATLYSEVQKRGVVDNVKARTSSLWAQVDKRTAPRGQVSSQGTQAQVHSLVTDGTQLPFDGTAKPFDA